MEVGLLSKTRVYEIAKQLNMSSKKLIESLTELDIPVQSHMSSLRDEEAKLIMEYFETSEEGSTESKKDKTPKAGKNEGNKPAHKEGSMSMKKQEEARKAVISKENNQQKENNKKEKPVEEKQKETKEEKIDVLQIPESITLQQFSELLGKQVSSIITPLMKKGHMYSANQEIPFELAEEIAMEFGVLVEKEEEKDLLEEFFKETKDDAKELKERSPVVVVMGHVDHGKTSLLDAIRESKVTENEAGGITQHIGASIVEIAGKKITFLDTPGHEAFTAMRMRGAQVTDIAILVVAADDGVMPQTIEAINHAKAAEIQIIVAINKMDKPGANPDRVKQELMEYGLVVEDWGGDIICVPVSAVTKEGIDHLLEMILLVAEMEELRANPNKNARGTIIEGQLDRGRGTVATVLVENGTLKIGDPIVAGTSYGKIRAMMDDKGRRVKEAGPSTPVEILGLSEVPSAGDRFYVAKNEKQARHVAEKIVEQEREKLLQNTPHKVSLDALFDQIQAGNMKELNIVVKADTQGSVEAVKQSLERLTNEEVRIRIIHGGVGAVTESDVMLASASNAIIIGFNVRPETGAKAVAKTEAVDIRLYRIIYNAIEDIEAAMKGLLDPIFQEKVIGHAEIRQTFKASGVGTIGGSYVLDGKITRNCSVRIIRNGIVVYEGQLNSLKRFKDDVKEVNAGYECGLLFDKFNDIKESDQVEAYIMEEVER